MAIDPQRVKQLFDQALERPTAERPAFLDGACGGDTALRSQVDTLLLAIDRAGEFLADASTPHGDSEHPGAVIDRYKLLQEIGEGGFGTVWMAEQQRPVRRKVAFKVLKLGMDTRQVVARFEVERQALALMDHPNIAKVLDGGVTPGGRPFFVMELVRGVPITEYCDQASLGTAERLELFQRVCHAVQHAHQKGVIHRDIKPSNILVTLHDGVPVPKVIDFGIAKATSGELTQRTLFTEYRQMIGTPEYMAPEQAEMSGLDVDTRADVYSLGVLLYEMLTGTKPFDGQSLVQRGYLEMLRVIREEEPPKPSTRISTMGEQLTAAAKRRSATPIALSRLMRGDVDWIVMKAMEKDRNRRYGSANELAADIGRHLSDEPVHASPPSVAYKLRKYLKRHKVGVVAGASVGIALVVGLAAATMGYVEARNQWKRATAAEAAAIRQRDDATAAREVAELERGRADAEREKAQIEERKAKTEAARANTVIELVQEMMGSADPHEVKGRDYTVRQLLDDFDLHLTDKLADQPEVQASLSRILGTTYRNLGLLEKATTHLERSIEIREQVLGGDHPQLARSLKAKAELLHDRGEYAEALELVERAKTIFDAAEVSVHDRFALEALRGDLLRHVNRTSDAEAVMRDVLSRSKTLYGDQHPRVAVSLCLLALTCSREDRHEEAEKLHRQALDIRRKVLGRQHIQTANSLLHLGTTLRKQRKFDQARRCIEEALEMRRALLGDSHHDVAVCLQDLAFVFRDEMEYVKAEGLLREALELRVKCFGERSQKVAETLYYLGDVLSRQGRYGDAEQTHRKALDMLQSLFGGEHSLVARSLSGLAGVHQRMRDFDGARLLYERALALRRQILGDDHPLVARELSNLATVYFGLHQYSKAEELCRQAIEIWQGIRDVAPPSVAQSFVNLGSALSRQGRHVEAGTALRKGLELQRRALSGDDPRIANCLVWIANVLAAQDKLEEAETQAAAAVAMYRRMFPTSHPLKANGLVQLGAVLLKRGKHAEAEAALRGAVEIQASSDLAPAFYAISLLGSALAGQGKYTEAEPLLMSGHENVRPPKYDARQTTEVLQRIVDLYESWGKEDKVKAWRKKLEAAEAAMQKPAGTGEK